MKLINRGCQWVRSIIQSTKSMCVSSVITKYHNPSRRSIFPVTLTCNVTLIQYNKKGRNCSLHWDIHGPILNFHGLLLEWKTSCISINNNFALFEYLYPIWIMWGLNIQNENDINYMPCFLDLQYKATAPLG